MSDPILAALKREHAGYLARGLKDRAAEVAAAIAAAGGKIETKKVETPTIEAAVLAPAKPRGRRAS